VRAYFVDIDSGDGSLLLNAPVPADVVIETSPGKYHGYWLTGGVVLEQFRARQLALAEALGGDSKVCDVSRVMRLPGFVHHKSTPFLSRVFRIREGL
jgi:RepB DNA-primase from phage plasmid